jgi:hypothetical protein
MRRVVIALLLVSAVGLLYAAGRNGNADPDPIFTEGEVEAVIPANGSPAVLRQAEIGIDLAPGWTGELNIDGVPIPDDQIRRNDPLNQLFFTPGEGKDIEQLRAGRVLVIASYWNFAEGETREDARQVSWSFTAV